jgi:hypothetical protein
VWQVNLQQPAGHDNACLLAAKRKRLVRLQTTDYRGHMTVLMMRRHASKDGGNLTLLYFSGMIMSSKRPRWETIRSFPQLVFPLFCTLAPFGWVDKPAEKHCWLICCERKILFRLKKQVEKDGL